MRRSFISLLIGVALAAFAVLLVSNYKDGAAGQNLAVAERKMAKVVVATRDMPFGSNVRKDSLQYAEWPADSVPEGAFGDMEALVADKEGTGNRVVLRALHKGEPLLQRQISGFGGKSTLSRKVGEGKRAFSVRVNDVSGVGGFLLPGDRVDVMLTQTPIGGSNIVTDLILQNIMILGIDQLTDEGSEKPTLAQTVTMEVSPDQAQKLALAQQAGTLSLTLRNYANNTEIVPERIAISDLTGIAPGGSATDSVSNAGKGVIRIRRGMTVEDVTRAQ